MISARLRRICSTKKSMTYNGGQNNTHLAVDFSFFRVSFSLSLTPAVCDHVHYQILEIFKIIFYMQNYIICRKRYLYVFLSSLCFSYFSCLTELTRTFSTMLNISDSRHLCSVPDLCFSIKNIFCDDLMAWFLFTP